MSDNNVDLRKQLEELLSLRQKIDAMVADLAGSLADDEGKVELPNSATGADLVVHDSNTGERKMLEAKTPTREKRLRGRPRAVRLHVLDCLEDIGWIAYTREIAQYSAARYGREIPSTRFGPLGADEVKSYNSPTIRPVWLCYALTHDRFEPIKRLLGRSDWPLDRRIVAPTSGRVQHLKMTARLSELALEAESEAVDPQMLRIIAADHARDLPGIKVKRGQFDPELWRDTAMELLEEIMPRDEEVRREAAARLENRPEFQQLFGMPEVVDLEPGRGKEALR